MKSGAPGMEKGPKEMTSVQIMVVEDEIIIALELKERLESVGYVVPAVVHSGEGAVKKARELTPDIILMDIVLKGGMSGIDAARQIHEQFNIPVVYLSAYTDDDTLQKAKMTEPFGYLIKPFEERALQATIEMSLFKHERENELRAREQWCATALRSMGDAVLTTDVNGSITFMNPVAEALTGWPQKEALGRKVSEVFPLQASRAGESGLDPAREALQAKTTVEIDRSVLTNRQGERIFVGDSAAPMMDRLGTVIGAVLVFRQADPVQPSETRQRS